LTNQIANVCSHLSLSTNISLASAAYPKEEFCAEMGAAFLCAEAGISTPVIENQAAVADWLKKLRDDRRLVVYAAAQAQQRQITSSAEVPPPEFFSALAHTRGAPVSSRPNVSFATPKRVYLLTPKWKTIGRCPRGSLARISHVVAISHSKDSAFQREYSVR
jgi:hypothetical protein